MMMPWLVHALLIGVGLIHIVPVTGVLGADALSRLYGLGISDPNLLILMRHRAVLFAIVGVLLLAAVVRPTLVWPAITAGFVSVGSFLWIASSGPTPNAEIARVVLVDWVALAALFFTAALQWMMPAD